MRWILEFDDPAAAVTELSGGKGASLARMTGAGFPVPPGVILRSEGYRSFVENDAELESMTKDLSWTDAEKLHEECAVIRHHLRARSLPEGIEREIRSRVPSLLEAGPVAVRSSSTFEDLEGAAFAGQHDTFLNVRDLESVIDAIRRCWSSLWEDRAARYREEHGFEHERAAMAVVIQVMVASDVAGVAFTIDPITGDTGRIVVNASWGLGETVVSGEGDVDQFILAKEGNEIIEESIAAKTHAIVGGPEGTERREVAAEKQTVSSLSQSQLGQLAELAKKVESYYGFPQDLEWAFAGEVLYLLQSRPVTRFPARWTRQESAERFPNPVTPLTWDFVRDGFHDSLRHSLELMEMPVFEGLWFERFDGYIYGNETAVKLFTSGSTLEFETLDELRELLPAIRGRYQWAMQLPVEWARDLDRYLIRLGRLDAVDVTSLSIEELWNLALEIDAVGREYFLPNIAISITHGLLHRMLFRFLQILAPEKAHALYDGLTCFCETKTSAVNREMRELALIVREDESLREIMNDIDRQELWKSERLEQFPRFLERFDRFLEAHGHREVDFDTYHPTWCGQPWVVLENVRLIAETGEDRDPIEREIDLRERQQLGERALQEVVPEDLRYAALELVRLARTYTSLDDLEHYQTTRLSIPFRRVLVELGSRLVADGTLRKAEDVFFLHKKSLEDLIARRTTADVVAAEAAEGLKAWETARETAPPFVIGEEETVGKDEDVMRGLPGSAGNATGEVFVVRGVEDFSRFPNGAVLVARTTNPAWTPLFHSAVAVVTESGGPLSHGAVTAREVGIPAVMAVHGIMNRLENGLRVTVDGTRGLVRMER